MNNEDYGDELINHYEIGKEIGFFDGALLAYNDILTLMELDPNLSLDEMTKLIHGTIAKYNELMEKLDD
jgi:hypothetical protein